MELENLLKLIDKVSSSGLDSFHMEEEGFKLSMKKKKGREAAVALSGAAEMPVRMDAESPDHGGHAELPDGKQVKAPLVGTFYNASSPEEEPFVQVGDTVKKGQVLGIIEAMKLMNEIECEYDGVVEAVLVENEQMVEYGQPLFVIR